MKSTRDWARRNLIVPKLMNDGGMDGKMGRVTELGKETSQHNLGCRVEILF